MSNLDPHSVQLQRHPQQKKGPQSLIRSIDLENRFRYDRDGRHEAFFGDNATIKPGCVLLVDQITSRTAPQTKYFAGVLLGVRKRGIMSNMVLRGVVMGTGVEMVFPLFSPMISKLTVLKQPPEQVSGMDACYWIR